ncbi:protein draper-like [Mya arenaria]|uniref:protein draper-like n=1 Tax=Mya arenaria TaxID=6604 RepID=UPI0022E1102F|nr:protein draper-like [Mya arenaria]
MGQCKPGYFGDFCEKKCSEKCLNVICDKSSGICYECASGYTGEYCNKTCSKECLNGRCNQSSGLCNDCTRTYLESCSQECGEGCREINGFPQCDRQSGKCLNGCKFYHYGFYCNNTCKNCKRNSSNSPCDINGVCQFGCENDYWDKKCNSKCSVNCQGDEHGKRCNSSTGECINGCTRGWSGKFCRDLKHQCESNRYVIHGCLGQCTPGYFGNFCEKNCSEKCLNVICDKSSGICNECVSGYTGGYCNKTCSKECLNGRCNQSSGLCNNCTRGYLESCSQECGVGCREINGFPQCDRQSGKCLNGCKFYHYGFYCNNTCKNCKQNSSNSPCDINGVCQFGCENDYWDKKCNSKCSANCQGDENGKGCNSYTGECINGCTRGWSGKFCGESTDKENISSLKTTSIVIPVIATVVVVVVGIICYVWARKRCIRQQNERMEPGQVLPVDVPPIQQPTGPWGPQSSSLYAEINEDTMEQYHYICEQNSPDQYDEINVTEYDRDIGVPSKEFTDDSNSPQSITNVKNELEISGESISRRSITHSYSDLDHACKTDNINELNPRHSIAESNNSIELPAARDSEKGEEIFGDLGQYQVDYIHAIAREICDNELDQQTIESSL